MRVGVPRELTPEPVKRAGVAQIDEPRCIGCTLCIEACPVDAIVGARGLMHTVVEPWCIGCALCLPPCPVDCIDMLPARAAWTPALKRAAGDRGRQRKKRLARKIFISKPKNRKTILAAALARKRR
jgi:RnfABCDGE-type electron transport complex B subunit